MSRDVLLKWTWPASLLHIRDARLALTSPHTTCAYKSSTHHPSGQIVFIDLETRTGTDISLSLYQWITSRHDNMETLHARNACCRNVQNSPHLVLQWASCLSQKDSGCCQAGCLTWWLLLSSAQARCSYRVLGAGLVEVIQSCYIYPALIMAEYFIKSLPDRSCLPFLFLCF